MSHLHAKKRIRLAIWSVVAGMLFAVLFYILGPVYHVLHGAGVFEHHDKRIYNATNEGNLKALWTGMMAYHESEGQFPQAAGWMDAIKDRVRVEDMKTEETMKKFVNPLLDRPKSYGYAMNDAAGGKFKGDLKDPKTPLLFDTDDPKWNAHGDPKKLKDKKAGDLAVTVDGSIVHL